MKLLLLLLLPTLVFAADIDPKNFNSASTLTGTETVPIYQNGWKKTTVSNIRGGLALKQYSSNSNSVDGTTWVNTKTQSLVTRIGRYLYTFAFTLLP